MIRPQVHLRRCASPQDLAAAAAQEWIQTLRSHPPRSHTHTVALPGGRIAAIFFQAIARSALVDQPHPLLHTHFFWGDERCVPPDHADSNYQLAKIHLLDPLQISPAQIHRTPGEVSPEIAAAQLQKAIASLCRTNPEGVPVLDTVFLGMGEDGHIASLFPASTPTHQDLRWVFPVVAPKPPPQRVTIGYPLLQAASQVWVLASGTGKAAALRASIAGPSTPLGRLIQMRPEITLWHDFDLGRP